MNKFLLHGYVETMVNDLRDCEVHPGPVRVYKMNPDGSKGEFIKEEAATEFNPPFSDRQPPGRRLRRA